MGQRLIINNDTSRLALNNIYYHWSAYTESAVYELNQFIKNLEKAYANRSEEFLDTLTPKGKELIDKLDNHQLSKDETVDLFNLMTYHSVSGIYKDQGESLDYIETFTTDTDRQLNRNEGLLAISEDDQNELSDSGEYYLIVTWVFNDQGYPDFEKSTFDFSNLFDPITDNDYDDYFSDGTPKKDLPTSPYKLLDTPLTDIETIRYALEQGPHQWKNQDNDIFTFIE